MENAVDELLETMRFVKVLKEGESQLSLAAKASRGWRQRTWNTSNN